MKILQLLNRAYREYLRRKYLQRAVHVMAVIVVFCTTYALILPAITLESATVCGIAEHTHTDSCYEAAEPTECTLPESEGHTHTEECFQVTESMDCTIPESGGHVHTEQCYAAEEPAECTIPESEGHTHTEECYRETSVLTCTLPETEGHTHTDSCIEIRYTEVPSDGSAGNAGSQETQAAVQVIETIHYICGMEETQGHTHGDGCYTLSRELVCGKEETPGHTHSDSCRAAGRKLICGLEESEGHTHGEGCVTLCKRLVCGLEETPGHSHQEDPTEPALRLICGLEEHTHSEACYPVTEPVPVEETLPADTDPTADLETDADWEASLSAVTLTGDWSYDLLAVARSQLGYTESKINYITEEDGTVRGYTRYGQWYGDPYADWSAMFVSFCLHYAEVEGIAPHQDCQEWLDALQDAGIYRSAGEYAPVPGDILFLDRDEDGLADQAGIVEDTADATQDSFSTCRIIAGDCGGQVDRKVLEAGYHGILGYAVLPTEPVKEFHLHSAPDGTMTEVYLGEDTAVPGSARLTVTALEETDDQYAAMANQVMQAIPGAVAQVTLLDISFFDAAGSYLSVSETATVSICYPGSVPDPSQVKVFHFVDGVPVELTDVFCQPISTLSLRNEAPAQTVLTFQTEGFSVFAVVNVLEDASRITLTDPATLDGNAYYIVSNNNQYYMLDEMQATNLGLAKGTYSGKDSLANAPAWTFLMQADGTFLIRSENGKYMVMEDNDTQGYAKVSLTEDMAAATAFTIRAIDGQAEIGYDGPNSIAHYLNVFSGSTDFRGWKDSGTQDTGSKVYLHAAEMSDDSQIQTVTNLGGKVFAIVSKDAYNGYYKALAATTTPVNSVTGLSTTDTTLTTIDGAQCVDGSAQLWTFHATDKEGVYTISTQVNGETPRYLRLLDNPEVSSKPDGRGSLMLGDAAQEITVIANGDGSVSLSATVNGQTGYVNLDNNKYNYWTYNGADNDNSKLLLCLKTSIDSAFDLTYGSFTITLKLRDTSGNPLYTERVDQTMEFTDRVIFADFAPDNIDGYIYTYAAFTVNGTPITVNYAERVSDSQYRIFAATYDGSNGDYCTLDRDAEITLVYRPDAEPVLNYSFTDSWLGDGWENTPSLASASQTVSTTESKLYSLSGKNEAGKFIRDTIGNSSRSSEDDFYTTHNVGLTAADANYLAAGAEYRFLYWAADNIAGTECLFPENAPVYLGEDGYIHIQDANGTWQTVYPGITLQGKWQVLSNVIFFYVNHGDTLLATQSGKAPPIETGISYYTEIAAIGHVYNLDKMGDLNTYSRPGIDLSLHKNSLEPMIKPSYDTSITTPYIVIDALKVHSGGSNYEYQDAGNCNETLLEAAISAYIRSPGIADDKKITLGGAELDQADITPENFELSWYNMKVVDNDSDAYHMDGVLVARVVPVEIYKTFSGLDSHSTSVVPKTLIQNMTFPVHLLHAETSGGTTTVKRDHYTDLDADTSVDGVFVSNGWQNETNNIYKWTLQSVLGQSYALQETGYDLAGHDCSSLISVHYTDGTIAYEYGTASTYLDQGSGTDDVPATNLFEKGIIGGQVKSIIFANFYTPTGTGMFSVSKVADDAGQVRLSGAEFTLYDDEELEKEIDIRITNENGAVHFDNLGIGTYYLKETQPPTGYQQDNTVWVVAVTNANDSGVVVTIREQDSSITKTLYTTGLGILEVYRIKNQPVSTTVTVNGHFEGIRDSELRPVDADIPALYDTDSEWTDDYHILVKDGSTTKYVLTLYGNSAYTGIPSSAQLVAGTAITGDMGYSWTIDLPAGKDYTFEEYHFLHPNYLDTVVDASYQENAAASPDVSKSDIDPGDGVTEYDLATFTVSKGDAAGTVDITNRYTNQFVLKIHKVDATANNAPIANVQFKIFGDFDQATGSESTTYKDSSGKEHTVYLVKTLTTDANGYATYDEMRLSSGSRSFLYVISEVSTPDGYVPLQDPIVRVVDIDSDNYSNGVYSLTIENVREDQINDLQGKISLTVNVAWDLPDGLSPADSVTIHLYRKTDTGTVEEVTSATLDGGSPLSRDISANENGWSITWTGLDYTDYYILQDHLPGFHTDYSTYTEPISVNGQLLYAPRVKEGTQLNRTVTVTNTTGYELPETGGPGTGWHISLGLMLMLAGLCLYPLGTIRRKRQGGLK